MAEGEHEYEALGFRCPGCDRGGGGFHLLPIGGDVPDGRARWEWDGNLDAPTLHPSILTRGAGVNGEAGVCHSFLRGGVFEFLSDCTHQFAGQRVPMPPLEDWMVRD